MGKGSDSTFLSSNGKNPIRLRQWSPEGPARAVVQIVHGVAEHMDRYDGFAGFLASHGFAVAGCDHLGHGKSIADDSELGWFDEKDGWSLLLRDQKQLRDRLCREHPGLPVIVLGHSMGSFVTRTYLGLWPGDFSACILSGTGHTAPAVCLAGKTLSRLVAACRGSKYRSELLQSIAFGGYLKRIDAPASAHDWICSDPEVVRRYDADPLCGFTATAGLMRDMTGGLYTIAQKDHIARMDKAMPVLLISGSEDPVGGYGKGVEHVAEMFRDAGMEQVDMTLYPDMRHEILNEYGHQTVWDDVLRWIERQL